MSKKAALKQLARYQDYNSVFNSPSGKRVLLDLMNKYSVLSPMYKGDVNELLVHEGQRKVILDILNILKIDVIKLKERVDEYVHSDEE